MSFETPDFSSADPGFVRELAELIINALELEIALDTVGADTVLYGDGLGLDSIDVLEIALLVSKRYGVQLRADDERNEAIFATLGSLAAFVAANRAG